MFNLQSVDDSGNVTENRQEHIDAKVGIETTLEEDTDGRQEDGKDDLDDVAAKRRNSSVGEEI